MKTVYDFSVKDRKGKDVSLKEYANEVLLIVNTAPMIAHYIALTNTKVTNVSFYIIILITLGITIGNVWTLF